MGKKVILSLICLEYVKCLMYFKGQRLKYQKMNSIPDAGIRQAISTMSLMSLYIA